MNHTIALSAHVLAPGTGPAGSGTSGLAYAASSWTPGGILLGLLIVLAVLWAVKAVFFPGRQRTQRGGR